MEQKIEHIEKTSNLANSIYFKCENCGKILMTVGTRVNSINNICVCDNPKVEMCIYINTKD